MFKRIFACAVCVVLLLSVCSQAVSARAATTTFTLSTTDGKAGETVTVSVALSADSYFTNCTFYVHYDSRVVSYVEDSETPGPISPPTSMLYVMDHKDRQFVKGAYVTVKGIKKEGVLLSLDFTVLQEAAMPFSISFDECVGVDENDSEFDVTYQVVPCTLNAHAAPLTPDTTAAPVSPTATPANPTAAPANPTAAPANPTAAPANPTAAPANPTAVPVNPTAAPVNPTAAPANPTAAPANPTAAPANPTTAPANPTAAPGNPTNAPAVPQGTTAAGQSIPADAFATTVTAAIGQNATLPTTVPTDAQGNTLATVPTTVVTNADGVTVTQPVGDVPADEQAPDEFVPSKDKEDTAAETAPSVLGIVLIIVACVLIAGGVAVAAVLARKKRAAGDVAAAQETPAQETPCEEATTEEASVEVTTTDVQ